jgi:hypothetical protein
MTLGYFQSEDTLLRMEWNAHSRQCDQIIGRKFTKSVGKSTQNSCVVQKCQNIYTKTKFESQEHLC